MRQPKVDFEPGSGQGGDLLQSAGFLEQMGRPGHDFEPLIASELVISRAVHVDDGFVETADDQQRRGGDVG